jgi:hypothetical protein
MSIGDVFDLVNLKVGAIEWKAPPHCCSTGYLSMICFKYQLAYEFLSFYIYMVVLVCFCCYSYFYYCN